MVGCTDDLLGREVRGGEGRLSGLSVSGGGARRRDRGTQRLGRWIVESKAGRLTGIGGWRRLQVR